MTVCFISVGCARPFVRTKIPYRNNDVRRFSAHPTNSIRLLKRKMRIGFACTTTGTTITNTFVGCAQLFAHQDIATIEHLRRVRTAFLRTNIPYRNNGVWKGAAHPTNSTKLLKRRMRIGFACTTTNIAAIEYLRSILVRTAFRAHQYTVSKQRCAERRRTPYKFNKIIKT